MTFPYHTILTQSAKSRKERGEVEAGGNRYFTRLSSFLLFFFFVKKPNSVVPSWCGLVVAFLQNQKEVVCEEPLDII